MKKSLILPLGDPDLPLQGLIIQIILILPTHLSMVNSLQIQATFSLN